jgi:myo-inositol-1(or 4)-monophosphatase
MTTLAPQRSERNTGTAARLLSAGSIAREAGRLATRFLADRSTLGVEMKGPQDFVTKADRAVEEFIIARLSAAFPGDGFVGEEGQAAAAGPEQSSIWIIDPIDGTANFVQGRDDWCVSIGFIQSGVPTIGVIYHPASDELYAAATGRGASRDGVPIQVRNRTTIAEATIALEYSAKTPPAAHLSQIAAVLGRGGEYRRNGSAALSLAHVADGRLDGFVELRVHAWDVLAGMVLVTEAGGWTSGFPLHGDLRQANPFLAAAIGLRQDLLDLAGLDRGTNLV